MDYYEQRQREVQEDRFYEPPYCDHCGGEHDSRVCDVQYDDDQYTGPTFREDDS